jgi:uncharacterized protein YkwD
MGGGQIRGLLIVAAAIVAALVVRPHLLSDTGTRKGPLPPQALGVHTCAGSQVGLDQVESPTARAAVLCLVNAERTSRSLPALTEEPRLDTAAITYARTMRDKDFFAHEGLDGSTPHGRIIAAGYPADAAGGENLAWGTHEAGTPSAIVRGWMESKGHRENILRPEFRHIGIGIVRGSPRHGWREDGSAIYVTPFGG